VSASNYPALAITAGVTIVQPARLDPRALFVYQTHDGGRTWGAPRPLFPAGSSQAGLRTHAGTEVGVDQSFQFLDATHWWVAMQVESGSTTKAARAASTPTPTPTPVPTSPVLFTTTDGGATWTTHLRTRALNNLRFVSASEGWAIEIVAGVPDHLVHTTDGGA